MALRGRWVLVTGASSGLGREIARQLALKHGANLILVARRTEQLNVLQHEIAAKAQSIVIPADLTQADEVRRVFEQSIQDRDVYAVVLNAGVTYFGHHRDLPWDTFQSMLALNVSSPVQLMHAFVPYLINKNQGGGILVVSSLGGLVPLPYQTAYAGTKAFLTTFCESWYQELLDENISITTFAPGGIKTEMTDKSGLAAHFGNTAQMHTAQYCASQAIQAMVARRYLFVPGRLNRLQMLMARFLPRRWLGTMLARVYRRALTK